MALDRKKTAVILLGADSFPKSENFQDSEAFLQAKGRIAGYFIDTLNVDQGNILDLFNAEKSPDEQDDEISSFIGSKTLQGIADLFVYYVGHGSFSPGDNAYFLATKGTRDASPAVSSLTIRTLGSTITRTAGKIRCYIILDCCFAGAAGTGFMSGGADGAAIQLKDAFASKGIALLCATSKDLPALIVMDRKITMFTEGLEVALKKGSSHVKKKFLSLRDIQDLTYQQIQSNNPGKSVRPEIISPKQLEGDIADLDHFENYGFNDSRFDILAKKQEIETELMSNNLTTLGSLFIDFVRNFNEDGSLNNRSVLLCSKCSDLLEDKEILDRADYKSQRLTIYQEILEILDQIMEHQTASSKKA